MHAGPDQAGRNRVAVAPQRHQRIGGDGADLDHLGRIGRVGQRQHTFDATLFGSLLPAEAWESVPEGLREELRAAAPNFDPGRPRGRSRS